MLDLEKNTKDITEIIAHRRAVFPRVYNDKPVSREDIETILQAANWAPTHRKTEPWRFKVVTGKKLIELGEFMAEQYKATATKFSERKYMGTKEKYERSSSVILICMQRDLKERVPEWEEIAATAMAVQNMWLTASELGIGSYWSTPGYITEVGKFVDLKEGERCMGIFYMGHYDAEIPEGVREPWEDKVEWL